MVLIILLILLWRAHGSKTCGCYRRGVESLKAHPFTLWFPPTSIRSETRSPSEEDKDLPLSESSIEAKAGTIYTITEMDEIEESIRTGTGTGMGVRSIPRSRERDSEQGRLTSPSSRATLRHQYDANDGERESYTQKEIDRSLRGRPSQDTFDGITGRLPESPKDGERLPQYYPSPTTASPQSPPIATNVTPPMRDRTRGAFASFGDRLVAPVRRTPQVAPNPLGDLVPEYFPSPTTTTQLNLPPIVLSPLPPLPLPLRSTRPIRPLPPLPIPLVPVRPPPEHPSPPSAGLHEPRNQVYPDLPPPYAKITII